MCHYFCRNSYQGCWYRLTDKGGEDSKERRDGKGGRKEEKNIKEGMERENVCATLT